jgi:hypothetical protein
LGSSSDWSGAALPTKEKIQNESDEGIHGPIKPFCSRIHIPYFTTATAKTANAIEKAACLMMVMPKTVARCQARSPGWKNDARIASSSLYKIAHSDAAN